LLRKTSKAQRSTKKKSLPRKESVKTRASNFSSALKVYEAALKLMHAEAYEKAKAKFGELTQRFTDEMELLDRANVLIQACDQRIRDKRSPVPKLKTADDYYEVAIGEMNNRRLDIARDHLNAALKRSPKADHVLYALAAVSALSEERDDALEYLKKSIQYRNQNRFLAVNDTDLESLFEDPEFSQLIKPEES
jgi:tetratricopeptide (TPR) repeat protein